MRKKLCLPEVMTGKNCVGWGSGVSVWRYDRGIDELPGGWGVVTMGGVDDRGDGHNHNDGGRWGGVGDRGGGR